MGLLEKVKPKGQEDQSLIKKEAEFLLAKLRTATFKGDEFEMFFTVFKKITEHIKTLK